MTGSSSSRRLRRPRNGTGGAFRGGRAARGRPVPKGEKDLLFRINRVACRYFFETLQGPNGGRGRDYLQRREVRDEMIQESYLGYAPAEGRALAAHLRDKNVPIELAEKLGLIRRN